MSKFNKRWMFHCKAAYFPENIGFMNYHYWFRTTGIYAVVSKKISKQHTLKLATYIDASIYHKARINRSRRNLACATKVVKCFIMPLTQ